MLIIEDVMLLLLDDESGRISGEGTLHYTLAGALLAELACSGAVEIEEKASVWKTPKIHAVKGSEPDDPMLQQAYDVIAEKPRGAWDILMRISGGLRQEVTDRLVAQGLVRREAGRSLGILPTTTWPAANTQHKEQLAAEVLSVLRGEQDPDARTGTVISLLFASNQLRQVFSSEDIPWKTARERAREISEGNWGAGAVKDVITATNAATIAATTAAVSSAVATVVVTSAQ